MTSRRLVLADSWNALRALDIDRAGESSGNNKMDVKSFRDFFSQFDFVDKCRNVHHREVV